MWTAEFMFTACIKKTKKSEAYVNPGYVIFIQDGQTAMSVLRSQLDYYNDQCKFSFR